MKTRLFLGGSAALLAVSLASGVRAQESPKSDPFLVTQNMARARAGRSLTVNSARPSWLEKTIDVNIKNERPADAVKRIVKLAGKSVDSVEMDEGLSDVRLSLSVRGVKAGDALAAVGRIGGAVASVSDRDDKVTVYLKKRNDRTSMLTEFPAFGSIFTSGAEAGMPAEYRVEVNRALAEARETIANAKPMIESRISAVAGEPMFLRMGAKLPEKRVSVDLKDVEVRDALKKVLGEAGVAFVLEDNLPTDKKTFNFSNVPLRLALDVLCQSSEVGWRAEKSDDKGGVLVKVGKKYVKVGQADGFSFEFPGFEGLRGLGTASSDAAKSERN